MMADSTVQNPPTEETSPEKEPSLGQPLGAVQMADLAQQSDPEDGSGAPGSNKLPVPEKDVSSTDVAPASTGISQPAVSSSAKGKEKEEQTASDKDDGGVVTAVDDHAETPAKGKERAATPGEETSDVPSGDKVKMPPPSEHLACRIALLHAQLSSRWTFKIDERYLDKRGVEIPGTSDDGRKDPLSLTVKTLKELILREWKSEWQTPPTSIQYIRLIYYGKFLQDEQTLSSLKFSHNSENVVHMTVTPADLLVDEDLGKRPKSPRDEQGNRGERSGCCVIL